MRRLDISTLKELLCQYAKGQIQTVKKGFQICCPWHDDRNPSCVVFPEGNFFCWVCHGDKGKGQRGVNPYKGFIALGMPEDRAKRIFYEGTEPNIKESKKSATSSTMRPKPNPEENIELREKWPKDWGFRGVPYGTLTSAWFKKRFDPTLVRLNKERNERLALLVGGMKNIDDPLYVRHEVYLRVSTSQKRKSVNSEGLTFDPEVTTYLPATLLGLVDNKLREDCKGVFLTEGAFDIINLLHSLDKAGECYDVVGLLGTCQWGNVFKQLQSAVVPQMIKNNIPFILAFDNDEAGFKVTKRAIEDLCQILPRRLIKIFNYPLAFKDIGDLKYQDFCDAFVWL